MRFFRRDPHRLGQSVTAEGLMGKWFGRVDGEPVAMEFRPDGQVAYVVQAGAKQLRTILTWRLGGDQLITNQATAPREERSRVRLEEGDLILEFGGTASRFSR
jgi:hypothetical protein